MKWLTYLILAILVLAAPACRSVEAPQAVTAQKGSQTLGPVVQTEWDRLVAAARKEGSVLIVGTALGGTKQVMSQAFRAKYDISLEYIDGRGGEVVARVLAERKAGIYSVDMGHVGTTTFQDIKKNKITLPLEPFLFLPGVVDGKQWTGGRLPFIDRDRHALAFVSMVIPSIVVNTDVVRPDEITRNTDLLSPRWKGKIVIVDPSMAGASNNWFTHVVTQLYGRDRGLQFMRDLIKQEPVLTRDNRLQLEWVARGKYPVGVGQSNAVLAEFKQAGAPVANAGLGEVGYISGGSGNAFMFDQAPHPNASKLYLNFLLSKEGSQLWSPAHGYPSLRLDVNNEQFDAALIPPRDTVIKTEEYIELQIEMRDVAKEIFRDLLK